uniref:Uncharacterized protein n=1 Tax=Oryza meridionalis TaxID=40149 RepID=A0A0E0F152_9ORYZ
MIRERYIRGEDGGGRRRHHRRERGGVRAESRRHVGGWCTREQWDLRRHEVVRRVGVGVGRRWWRVSGVGAAVGAGGGGGVVVVRVRGGGAGAVESGEPLHDGHEVARTRADHLRGVRVYNHRLLLLLLVLLARRRATGGRGGGRVGGGGGRRCGGSGGWLLVDEAGAPVDFKRRRGVGGGEGQAWRGGAHCR